MDSGYSEPTMAYLFYLMGPSGSGKDSIIQGVRQRMGDGALLVAHRYITRHWKAGGENHVELNEQEFEHRVRSGLLCLHWQANGCRYGVGAEVTHWLDRGFAVLVNGSREHLDEAIRCFGDRLVPVLVTVESAMLHQRLQDRGRESEQEIIARVERSARLQCRMESGEGVVVLPNDGSLEHAVERMVSLIDTYEAMVPHV